MRGDLLVTVGAAGVATGLWLWAEGARGWPVYLVMACAGVVAAGMLG